MPLEASHKLAQAANGSVTYDYSTLDASSDKFNLTLEGTPVMENANMKNLTEMAGDSWWRPA